MSDILPNHDVTIGTRGFYAQNCKSDSPFSYANYDRLDIQRGLPRFYKTNISPRHITFNVTLNVTDRIGEQNKLKSLLGIQSFNSIWVGTFQALVKMQFEWPDGYPNTLNVSFDITEVG